MEARISSDKFVSCSCYVSTSSGEGKEGRSEKGDRENIWMLTFVPRVSGDELSSTSSTCRQLFKAFIPRYQDDPDFEKRTHVLHVHPPSQPSSTEQDRRLARVIGFDDLVAGYF
jgi:hypothetical protein